MKKFDIEKAKAGAKVCTKDGRKARIICFDKYNTDRPIVALVRYDDYESIFMYSNNGEYYIGQSTANDLMIVGEKHYAWANIYKKNDGTYITGCHHPDKESALEHKCDYDDFSTIDYIDTIKIEWEE